MGAYDDYAIPAAIVVSCFLLVVLPMGWALGLIVFDSKMKAVAVVWAGVFMGVYGHRDRSVVTTLHEWCVLIGEQSFSDYEGYRESSHRFLRPKVVGAVLVSYAWFLPWGDMSVYTLIRSGADARLGVRMPCPEKKDM
jgi:hypothetical protein